MLSLHDALPSLTSPSTGWVPSAWARPNAPTPASQICCADSLRVFDSFPACACMSSALAREPAVFFFAVFLNLAMCPPTGSCDCPAASPHCLEHSHETRRPVQRLRARLRVVARLAMTSSAASGARRRLAVGSDIGRGGGRE